jgi:hypothetical protein
VPGHGRILRLHPIGMRGKDTERQIGLWNDLPYFPLPHPQQPGMSGVGELRSPVEQADPQQLTDDIAAGLRAAPENIVDGISAAHPETMRPRCRRPSLLDRAE